jgi:hypothetical protein
MAGTESTIVLFPRFTTLVGPGPFTSAALDCSRFGSAQFQVWRSTFGAGLLHPPVFNLYFEESLDGLRWFQGPATPRAYQIADDDPKLFSYGFRLRWFRIRVAFTYADGTPGPASAIVTCWAEGLLR